jgi:hypothetical protein
MADLITDILLLLAVFWLMAVFFSLQRGFNQVIRGLTAIHKRLEEPGGKPQAAKPEGGA